MRVVRCKNGHFFNQDKYGICPYCKEAVPESAWGSQNPADDDVTVSLKEDLIDAVPLNGRPLEAFPTEDRKNFDDEEKTVGLWQLSEERKGDKTAPLNNQTDDDDEKTVGFWDDKLKIDEEKPPQESTTPVAGWLVCVEGPCRGRDYRLVEGRNFIGRSKEMDICIPEDAQLSRDCHCSVVYDPRSYRFVVLPGSSAASRLNDENIDGPIDLKDGDILCCGSTKLCFIGYCKEGRDWK